MEWTKVLSLCISCFSLGFSLCVFIDMTIELVKSRRRRKEREHAQMLEDCERIVREFKKKQKERLIEEMLDPRDPHKPIERLPNESTEQFIDRLVRMIAENKITLNAARASVGLPPPLHDKPDDPEVKE